jgi:hypothetical protein
VPKTISIALSIYICNVIAAKSYSDMRQGKRISTVDAKSIENQVWHDSCITILSENEALEGIGHVHSNRHRPGTHRPGRDRMARPGDGNRTLTETLTMTATTAATRRFLNIVMPFARAASGKLIGGIRVVTPAPYTGTDYYIVAVDENEAVFMKEDAAKTTHICDLDMNACDCAGYGYRRRCRHLDAIAALKKQGKI